jgi:catechol 2,3-dioxygenase-like lactoylglutathione lyase family enzyme
MARSTVTGTTPCFIVSDLQRSLDFYQKLGFREPALWGEPACFAMLNRDLFDLMLSLAEPDVGLRPNGPDKVWDLYVRVEDVREEMAALVEAGVEVVRGPEATAYDMLEIEVLDPDGHRVCFGQELERA